jgi:HEAT repeat protein
VRSLLAREGDIVDAYGLSNYQIGYTDGRVAYRKGNYLSLASNPTGTATNVRAARLASGTSQSLDAVLEQGTMLADEESEALRVVLPEMRRGAAAGGARYRLIVHFAMPSEEGKPLELDRLQWIALEPAELVELVENNDADPPTRLLAANWLAALDPESARAAVLRSTPLLNQPKVLVGYFRLLTHWQEGGMAARALELCQDPAAAADVRRLAAEYLGTVHHEPALKVLLAAARDPDDTVARGAIVGLGASGSPLALAELVAQLGDHAQRPRHLLLARTLAQASQPQALRMLEQLAVQGNQVALYALVESARPETFAFFRSRLEVEQDPERRELVLRGLRLCDSKRAEPVLLELLAKEEAPPASQPLETSPLVRELIILHSPHLVSPLAALAQKGNLRALQVLAGCRQDTVQAPLQEQAQNGSPAARLIALSGLSLHWAWQNVAILTAALASDQSEAIIVAAQGLGRSKDLTAVPALLAVLKHPDARVRFNVAAGLVSLPANHCAAHWLDALLATEDDQVALVLVDALIHGPGKYGAVRQGLGQKLKASQGDLGYQVIRLLRHLSGNAMGPESYFEYQQEPESWNEKWVKWATNPPEGPEKKGRPSTTVLPDKSAPAPSRP